MADHLQIKPYQAEFIDFLLDSDALLFGDFVTKSGRRTPYFINTGRFDTGPKAHRLGEFYAAHILESGLDEIDTIFGPAYKGIPLAVSTSIALSRMTGRNIGFTYDRKEEKAHGDKGSLVGYQLSGGSRVLLIDDVVTAGTTLRQVVPQLRAIPGVELTGMVIAVDRCEQGRTEKAAVIEAQEELDISISPIITIHHVVSYLSQENQSGLTLSLDEQLRIAEYLEQYGA